MNINTLIYLIEIILLIVALIIGLIISIVKHKKKYMKYLMICIICYGVIFGITYIIEIPIMNNKETYTVNVNTTERVSVPNTFYHFKNRNDEVKINGNINYNKIGEYNISFEIKKVIGVYVKNAIVKVIDTEKPEIHLKGTKKHNQSYGSEFEDPGYYVTDNYDENLNDKVKIEREEINETSYKIKYSVEDSSGNKSEETREIILIDDIAPELTINGNPTIYVYLGNNYNESGAKATDEKDGDLTEKIQIIGSVDTSKEGNYTITYKVADSSGNETVKERKVIVMKKIEAPSAQNGSNGAKGVIYLTFDDGPSTNITPKVLDILNQKNVKATFFILNYNSAGEQLVKREYAEGHTVAIHGYSHDYQTIYQSEEAYMENITKLQEKIRASIGYNATITRFPGGSSNKVSKFNPGIMSRLTNLVLEKGFTYFDWNVSSGDAGGASNSTELYNNVINGLSKSKANVVLMHDFASNSKLLDALPNIIDYGYENGYTFSKITENTPMVRHNVNN